MDFPCISTILLEERWEKSELQQKSLPGLGHKQINLPYRFIKRSLVLIRVFHLTSLLFFIDTFKKMAKIYNFDLFSFFSHTETQDLFVRQDSRTLDCEQLSALS